MLARNAICGAFKVSIPLSSVAAHAKDKLLTWSIQIRNGFFFDWVGGILPGATDDRAYRNLDCGREGVASVFVFAFASTAARRANERFIEEGNKIIRIVVSFQNDVPSSAAITAIRSTVRNEFFPSKAAASVAAVTGFCMDANLINKFHIATRCLTWRPESNGFSIDPFC